MFVKLPTDGYWFSGAQIPKIEEHYNAKYLGYWAIKDQMDNWSEEPVDVFYVDNPDKSKGHSNYFGLFQNKKKSVMICNAESAFSEPITGLLTEDGEVLVSRYRHDMHSKGEGVNEKFIDGGRDYVRIGGNDLGNTVLVEILIDKGSFIFRKKVDA